MVHKKNEEVLKIKLRRTKIKKKKFKKEKH